MAIYRNVGIHKAPVYICDKKDNVVISRHQNTQATLKELWNPE